MPKRSCRRTAAAQDSITLRIAVSSSEPLCFSATLKFLQVEPRQEQTTRTPDVRTPGRFSTDPQILSFGCDYRVQGLHLDDGQVLGAVFSLMSCRARTAGSDSSTATSAQDNTVPLATGRFSLT